MKQFLYFHSPLFSFYHHSQPLPQTTSWIRINQLGYKPNGIKVAVWCSKEQSAVSNWQLVEISSGKLVYSGKFEKPFGAYGPFMQTYRLNFSSFNRPGRYYFCKREIHDLLSLKLEMTCTKELLIFVCAICVNNEVVSIRF